MKIMGICATSLFDVKHFIEHYKASLDEAKQKKLRLQFVGFGETPKPDTVLALVPSMGAFKKVAYDFPKVCRVIVFDSPMLLENCGIKCVDTSTKDHLSYHLNTLDYDTFKFHLVNLMNGKYTADPDLHFDLIPHLLQEVQGSLTQNLLNITMQCKVPEKRRNITFTFLVWLLGGNEVSVLQTKLEEFGMDKDSIMRMVEWLESEQGKEARKVFIQIRIKQKEGKAINYDSICKGTSVEPFDVKYLLRHVRQLGTINKLNSNSVQEYTKRKVAKEKLQQELENYDIPTDNEGNVDIMMMDLDQLNDYLRENQ